MYKIIYHYFSFPSYSPSFVNRCRRFQHNFMLADVIDINRQNAGYRVQRVAQLGGMKGAANPQFAHVFILQADAGVVVATQFGEYIIQPAIAEY